MFGTIVNTVSIICGSLVGFALQKGIPEKYTRTIMQGVSLAVILVGISASLKSDAFLLVILSLAIGGLIGEWIDIEGFLAGLGEKVQKRYSQPESNFTKGFVTASLVFCVGSMAILGSLESGLTQNHDILFAKSALDGITSLVFATTFGIGVMFSAIPVFLYQGAITMAAMGIKPFLVAEVVAQMTSVGGLLILSIGLNLLEIAKIRLGNLLPAIFIPLVWFMAKSLFM